jgi:cytochrome c-type biogenesis protein CcmH/NrfG
MALQVLEQGYAKHPNDQEIIFMIASIYRDQEQVDEAMEWAQKLLLINPANQNALQFIEVLQSIKQ